MLKLTGTCLLILLFNISYSYAETYYVDSLKGKDTNNGLQPSTAIKSLWKASQLKLNAGDKLLLSNKHEFNGSLVFKNIFGEKNNPIIISSYPNKSKAQINAAGYLYGIHIKNSSFVNISDIAIKANAGGVPSWVNKQLKNKPHKNNTPMRIGIFIESEQHGDFQEIHINNIAISDVFYPEKHVSRSTTETRSANGTKSYGWGIRFIARKHTTLSNISISNSSITNVGHTGIKFTGHNKGITGAKLFNNQVSHTGGPGMQMSGVVQGHVSKNVVNDSGSSDDKRKWGRGSGMWTWDSSNILVEHNQFLNASGPGDSAGFHIDYNCDNVVVQYNLSMNNAGGFAEILGNNYNNAYRYNISINDGYRIKGKNNAFQEGKTFWLSGYQGNKTRKGPFNSYFYNNTIYVESDFIAKIAVAKTTKGALIANNIFYIKGESQLVKGDQYKPEKSGESDIENIIFENNLFLKANNWPSDVLIQDQAPIFGDAQFINAGGNSLEDYIPQNTALIKDKGINIMALPFDKIGLTLGLTVSKDILGNKIMGKPDMGAIEME
ncbi:MAG: hypothetical protein ACI9YH_002874 [Colwellia sp.]|jgi:hypothetical protein